MFACGALFVVAPVVGWWLPERKSDHAWDIDYLFYVILAVTGFFFVLTEALLVFFMFRYCTGESGEARKPSMWTPIFGWMGGIFNSAQRIEMAWTVVPALILLYIAFAQVDTWADVKYKTRLDRNVWAKDGSSNDASYKARLDKVGGIPVQIAVNARQFEWKMRYPSPSTWKRWKENPALAQTWVKNLEADDIYLPNELHIIADRHVVVQLSTK